MWRIGLMSLVAVLAVAHGIPKLGFGDDVESRVLDKDLSDQEHFIESHHNPDYDHEAFLGEDAKTFDKLSPDESVRRLGLIVDKIDADEDGFVSQEELKDWIRYTQQRYIRDDVDRQWKSHNPEDKNTITWQSYNSMVYGFMNDDFQSKPGDDNWSYIVMRNRDRRRWSVADQDGDDALTREEFTAFLHPEETVHMKDVVVAETLEDIDKDGDGKISMSEYIGDMYRGSDDDEEEPEWVKNEKEQFSGFRDKDKDGFMDTEEVKNWIIPEDFDHADAEARHLIYEADQDSDGKLTKDEILEKYDVFVGSQATDFGEALARHDEF